MGVRKKIYENSGKIRAVIAALIAALLAYRLLMLLNDDSYVYFILNHSTMHFIGYAPFVCMAADLFLVFYKGRAAAGLSIITMILGFLAAFMNGMFFVVAFLASVLSTNFNGLFEPVIEIVVNLFLILAAGVLLVLNERKVLDKRSENVYKEPLTKRGWETVKNIGGILKSNKKAVILIIKSIISAVLALTFINRAYAAVTGSFYHGLRFLLAIVPFLLIPSEIISLFLKGKTALKVRIANIIAANSVTIIELIIMVMALFGSVFGYLNGNYIFYLDELTENVVLMITAIGIFIGGLILDNRSVKNRSGDVMNDRPAQGSGENKTEKENRKKDL